MAGTGAPAVEDGEWRAGQYTVMTAAVGAHGLAVALLGPPIPSRGTAAGSSARATARWVLSVSRRLSPTLWPNGCLPVNEYGDLVNQRVDLWSRIGAWAGGSMGRARTWLRGYFPVDASGVLVYQVVDLRSLLIVRGRPSHVRATYTCIPQENLDSLPILQLVSGAYGIVAIFHPGMHSLAALDACDSSGACAFGLPHAIAGVGPCGTAGFADPRDGNTTDATRHERRRERSAGASGAPCP